MFKLNDININIGKDKIRTGVIFLSGFIFGGAACTIALKSKLNRDAEKKVLNDIDAICNDTSKITMDISKSFDEVTNCIDNLVEKTKALGDLTDNESNKSFIYVL